MPGPFPPTVPDAAGSPNGNAPSHDVSAGQVLGKCRLERELGRGGMGSVWLAEHTTLHVKVAVKVLPPAIAARDPQFAERFLREARLAAQLRHPHVVAVMDADRDPATGLHYIVQEFCSGGSVRDRMKHGPMPEIDALRVVRDMARALTAANKAGIVHRDIKPDNILVDADGHARLADLGLARQSTPLTDGTGATNPATADAPQLTGTDATLGTPAYMSPEQIDDARSVDIRSDLYSLGATLFHLVCGRPPFIGESLYQMLHKIVTEPAPDPRTLRDTVSESSAQLCLTLLQKNPADRLQTPEQLLSALKKHEITPKGVLKPVTAEPREAADTRYSPAGAPMTVAADTLAPTVAGGNRVSNRQPGVGKKKKQPARVQQTLVDDAVDQRRQRLVVGVVIGACLVALLLMVMLLGGNRTTPPTTPDPTGKSGDGNSEIASNGKTNANANVNGNADSNANANTDSNANVAADPPPAANNNAPDPGPSDEERELAAGLVLAMSFDDGDNPQRIPDLVNDRQFANGAGPLQFAAGRVGSGLRFSGNGTSLRLPGVARAQTIAFWARTDDASPMVIFDGGTQQQFMQAFLISTYQQTPDHPLFPDWRGAPGPGYCLGFWTVDILVPASITDWHHVVVTHNGRTFWMAIDGQLLPGHVIDGGPASESDQPFVLRTPPAGPRAPMIIGRMQDPQIGLGPFQGTIDELAIWNRTFSTAELTRLHGLAAAGYCERLATIAGN